MSERDFIESEDAASEDFEDGAKLLQKAFPRSFRNPVRASAGDEIVGV
jgi:hypothetical protein